MREIWVAGKLLTLQERPLRGINPYFKVINLVIINNDMEAMEEVPWMTGERRSFKHSFSMRDIRLPMPCSCDLRSSGFYAALFASYLPTFRTESLSTLTRIELLDGWEV